MDQQTRRQPEGSGSRVRKDDSRDRHPAGAGTETTPALVGDVVGHGLFRLVPRNLIAVRKRPGPVPSGWERAAPSLLRYSDEQTVAGVAAVFSAIEGAGLDPGRLEPWGVVVASRYLGRANLAQALTEFTMPRVSGGLAAPDPPFRPPFAFRNDQPRSRPPRAESGGRWWPARRGRGVSGGLDLAVHRASCPASGSS